MPRLPVVDHVPVVEPQRVLLHHIDVQLPSEVVHFVLKNAGGMILRLYRHFVAVRVESGDLRAL